MRKKHSSFKLSWEMNYEDHSDDAAKVAEKLELYSEAATIKKETVA